MSAVPRWPRPFFQRTDHLARVSVVAFGAANPSAPVEPGAQEGWPDACAWPEALRLRAYDLGDPGQMSLFEHCLAGSIRDGATHTLGAASGRLDTARVAIAIDGEFADPSDLAHLQMVHATLRWLARDCEVFAALNQTSIEWTDVAILAHTPASAVCRLADWIGMVFETDPDPRFGRVLHTRGMSQFGRPDIMMVGFPDEVVSAACEAINTVANSLAKGAGLRDGDRVLVARLSDGGTFERVDGIVTALRPDDNGPDVGLGNEGFILRLEDGVLRRLQEGIDPDGRDPT